MEKEIEQYLDSLNIEHETIKSFQSNNNHTFTDGEKVFIKLVRPGFSTLPAYTELSLANHYKKVMLEPLIKDMVDIEGTSMSIWKYEEIKTYDVHSINRKESALLAEEMNKIHSLPTDRLPIELEKMKNFDRVKQTIAKRVEVGSLNNASVESINSIQRASELFLQEEFTGFPLVLSHADPHFGNAGFRAITRKPFWFDFESARLAPKELDIGMFEVSTNIAGGNEEAWEGAKQVLKQGTDAELVRLFILLKLISMTSYLLLHPEKYEVLNKRAYALEEIIKTGKIPTFFPLQ